METLSCDADKVTPDARLAEDLEADSLAAVELSMALEEEFGVTIADEELPHMKTVGDLGAYRRTTLSNKNLGTGRPVPFFPKGAVMTNQEIFELMARFDASTATTLKLSTKDFSLELGKGGPAAPIPAAAPVPASAAAVPPAAAPAPAGKCITAPLVGTFYAASAPDAAPFVQVGDHVKKGQTVCLMEAMKMMNEVQAPCDCVIEEILQEDGALVSFGEPLLRYREG